MPDSQHVPIEETVFFKKFEYVAQQIWEEVHTWPKLAQWTIGAQVIRLSDSVGSNLVEGDGRFTPADSLHFFVIARGSARETALWIRRARKRKLLSEDKADRYLILVEEASKALNNVISYRRSRGKFVREEIASYNAEYAIPNTQYQSADLSDYVGTDDFRDEHLS